MFRHSAFSEKNCKKIGKKNKTKGPNLLLNSTFKFVDNFGKKQKKGPNSNQQINNSNKPINLGRNTKQKALIYY